jgi:D-alanine-D-alanine ligase
VGIDVNPDLAVGRAEYARDPAGVIERAVEKIALPCFVKPVSLGSSIGVSRCAGADELADAFELGFEVDRTVLVEPALDDAVEINCAVLGRAEGELRASACEQPVKTENSLLGFEEKYMSDGGKGKGSGGSKEAGMASQDRLIPAPIPDDLTAAIQDTARRAHRALGFSGVVRYDFLVADPQGSPRVVLNEANTVPGSFSFYLFEPAGLGFADLADELIEIALLEGAERRATTRTFDSILLETYASGQGTSK